MVKNKSDSTLKDEEIINQIRKDGNSKKFALLYVRYFPKVLDKCHSFVKNREIAEELAAEVFVKALEKLPSFKQMASFSSWLYTITYNHCIDYLRDKKNLHYPSWNMENEIPEIIDESGDADEHIKFEHLQDILERIHPEEKALLLMKYQDEISMKQIAGALRISEDAAKMRLKRARTRVVYLYTRTYPK